jgi:hypothetical protein
VSVDPDAAYFRSVARDLGALAEEHVRDAFAWVDRCLETGDDDGAIPLIIALGDLCEGRPLRVVLYDLLIAADAAGQGRDRHAAWSGAR